VEGGEDVEIPTGTEALEATNCYANTSPRELDMALLTQTDLEATALKVGWS